MNCGTTDLVFNEQTAQISPRVLTGAYMLTENMARLSQSSPMNLPEQNPENGHMAKARIAMHTVISSHEIAFSIGS